MAALRTQYYLCGSPLPPRTSLAVGGPCFQKHQRHSQHHVPASCFLARVTYTQESDGTELKCRRKSEMAMAEEGGCGHPCPLLLFDCPHSFHPALISGWAGSQASLNHVTSGGQKKVRISPTAHGINRMLLSWIERPLSCSQSISILSEGRTRRASSIKYTGRHITQTAPDSCVNADYHLKKKKKRTKWFPVLITS